MKTELRYLSEPIQEVALKRGKMAFISGPRQVGKTTLAQSLEPNYDEFFYKNWDNLAVKKEWVKDPNLLVKDYDFTKVNRTRLLVLDEIHKGKGWKSKLKGLYDTYKNVLQILVTGSAKLNVYKKGSDSLMGRYLHFRLHPFSVREIHHLEPLTPSEVEKQLFQDKYPNMNLDFSKIKDLYEFSGFPEPYFSKNKKVQTLWKRGRKEKIIKEDIRDLSRVLEISKLEVLAALLPEKVGSPLSVQSLREDLSISHDTTTRWLSYLKELYYYFDVTPYSKSISRSLKKDAKIYFYDWTECESDGQKFENFVALHLLKACHYWTDTGEGDFHLQYLRDKEKNEVDFLILKDKKPWFTVECKFQQKSLDDSFRKFQKQIHCPHVQVVFETGVFLKVDKKTWIMGVDYLLGNLV